MTTPNGVVRHCDRCRRRLVWTRLALQDHLDRLTRGEHAACACDDDCAAEVPPWTRQRLQRAIRAAERS